MNNDNAEPPSAELADRAMQQVLLAEREAAQAILRCEREVSQMLKTAQKQAQHLAARTNERISMLQMRYSQKLNRDISDIEQAGRMTGDIVADRHADEYVFNNTIDELAADLTTAGHSAAETDPDA